MSEYKNQPRKIIVEFLKTRLTDPRSRAENTTTDSDTGTGSSQTINLSPSTGKAYAITSVVDGSTTLKKWEDYSIDLQNQNISGTFTNGNNVTVTYKYGSTSWIYPDKTKESLSSTSYPRINVLLVNSPGDFTGNYQIQL